MAYIRVHTHTHTHYCQNHIVTSAILLFVLVCAWSALPFLFFSPESGDITIRFGSIGLSFGLRGLSLG